MEYIIIYKSREENLENYSFNINVLINHYRFLSESLTRRIDQKLNEILPKMFYEVEPLREKARFGIKVRVLDDHVSSIVKKFITPTNEELHNVECELYISSERWEERKWL